MAISTFDYLYTTEEDGVEIHMGTNANGQSFYMTLREIDCEKHEKTQRKYRQAMARARTNPKKQHEIMSKIIAESIIVDWRGIIDSNGKEVPCTMENKIDALVNHKKLLYAVIEIASDEGNFRDLEDETDIDVKKDSEKNSKKS